jgi:hypothetical protein
MTPLGHMNGGSVRFDVHIPDRRTLSPKIILQAAEHHTKILLVFIGAENLSKRSVDLTTQL